MTPTPAEFVAMLETQLRARGVAFSRSAVMAFVSSTLPLLEDHPDAPYWASRFLESGASATVPD
jgi:hypothetical protein